MEFVLLFVSDGYFSSYWDQLYCVVGTLSTKLCEGSMMQRKFKRRRELHVAIMMYECFNSFTEYRDRYQMIRILTRVGSQAVASFLHVLTTMGMLTAAFSGYACIKLFHQLPLTLYILISMFLPCTIIIIFTLVPLAAVPGKYSDIFTHFWKGKVVKDVEKRRLLACPHMRYSYGFITNVTMSTALSLTDVIVNFLASLVLLRFN